MSIALQAPQPEFRVGKTATVKKAKKGVGEAWNFRELDPHIVCGNPVPSLSLTGIAENPPESAKIIPNSHGTRGSKRACTDDV